MKSVRGFTLIEMAIVMAILGLVVVGATKIVLPVMDSKKADVTVGRLILIQKALQLYVIRYGCLPCPANAALNSGSSANAGQSLISGGTTTYVTATIHCTSSPCYATAGGAGGSGTFGGVPWITLGLSEDDVTDGWDHRIRYDVSTTSTPCTGGATGLQNDNGMVRCALGASPAYPTGAMVLTDFDSGSSASTGAYVLVSSGPDGSMARTKGTGSYTTDRYGQEAVATGQGRNYQGGAAGFAYGSFNATNGTSHFDDIVRTSTAANMIQKCGANACGNPF